MKEFIIGDQVYAVRTEARDKQCYWTVFKFTVKSKTITENTTTYNDLIYDALFETKKELLAFLENEVNWDSYKTYERLNIFNS